MIFPEDPIGFKSYFYCFTLQCHACCETIYYLLPWYSCSLQLALIYFILHFWSLYKCISMGISFTFVISTLSQSWTHWFSGKIYLHYYLKMHHRNNAKGHVSIIHSRRKENTYQNQQFNHLQNLAFSWFHTFMINTKTSAIFIFLISVPLCITL